MEKLAFLMFLVGAGLAAECPDRPVQEDFDVEKYMGTWYEVARFGNVFQTFVRCPKAEYKLNDDGTVAVNNSGLYFFRRGINWEATAKSVSPGKLEVSGTLPVIGLSISAPYWVLGTDYTNYAVVLSCFQQDVAGFSAHQESGWILSRSREPFTEEIRSQVNKVVTDAGLSATTFRPTKQRRCNN